jgi:septation ring formation regulator EzrA
MSFLNTFVNFIQKVVLVLIVVPAVFKLFEFLNNINQTINRLNESLKVAEENIGQLRNAVEELKTRIAENNNSIREQILTTMDMQQQLVDHGVDALHP